MGAKVTFSLYHPFWILGNKCNRTTSINFRTSIYNTIAQKESLFYVCKKRAFREFCATIYAVALAQPRAIEGRITNGIGVSYQHGFGEKAMLQVDLDVLCFYDYTFINSISDLDWGAQITATYNRIFSIKSWSGAGSWNWYAGIGELEVD